MDKKAASIGFIFIIALIILLASGIIYIILNQVYTNYLFNATTVNQVVNTFPYANASSVTQSQTITGYFWLSVPIFIIVMVILWIIVKAQSGGDQNQ